ncbi:hypothetical protein RJ639_011030 [Escallonia herrerae]|uniref:Replication protein A OB domain-containing protein n=1 Tax=Escallonia herrerae TaxID=1293975 RepID=A0AA88VPG3_9ASTE|nr:hypothetical protein RJ639_011030 [Escallonia herrerae]
MISTRLTKPVNPQFDSAHNRFELTFSSSTQVKEVETNINIAQLRLQFVSFNDLKHRVEDNGIIDVVGLLADIDNLSLLKKPRGGGIMKRDMILTNTEFDTVVITLWADLAKNEGNILSELADDKPIVVLSKAKVTRYGGLVSLSTRSEVEALKSRYMLKLTVGNGVRNVYVTLFEAAERIINCPEYDFINSKDKIYLEGHVNKSKQSVRIFFFQILVYLCVTKAATAFAPLIKYIKATYEFQVVSQYN